MCASLFNPKQLCILSTVLSVYYESHNRQKLPPPSHGATAPSRPGPPHYLGFAITLRRTTLGGTPLDNESARRRDLDLTTHDTHNRQISMPQVGFEPAIPASERPQTHALYRAVRSAKQHHYLVYFSNAGAVLICEAETDFP